MIDVIEEFKGETIEAHLQGFVQANQRIFSTAAIKKIQVEGAKSPAFKEFITEGTMSGIADLLCCETSEQIQNSILLKIVGGMLFGMQFAQAVYEQKELEKLSQI